MEQDKYFHSVYQFISVDFCDTDLVLRILNQVCSECATVTLRQLQDFIIGDFSKEGDELRSVLTNCPLTILVGESSFGDLDYDIKRRSHCSDLKRSAAHCIKRNKTASLFLDKKSPKVRAGLFSMARKKSKELIEEAKLHHVDVSIKIKEKMVQNQSVLLEREIDQISKEDDIRKRVKGLRVVQV